MDDERLIARLRRVEGADLPRQEFVDALHERLAADLGLGPDTATRSAIQTRRRPAPRHPHAHRVALLLAAAISLIVLALALVGAGAYLERVVDQPTLLESIERTGLIRVAVRADQPQSQGATGSLDGFDLSVAGAIADRLGARPEPVILPPERLLAPGAERWLLSMPSRFVTLSPDVIATKPYYRWPVIVGVRPGAAPATLDSLAGATMCAVAGSAGAAWLEGRAGTSGMQVVAPPKAISIVIESDDAACLESLTTGRVSGIVTARLLLSDLAADGRATPIADGPVAFEPASILIPADGRGAGELRARIDEILGELRRDGTLADLSRRWFGGEDLTAEPGVRATP